MPDEHCPYSADWNSAHQERDYALGLRVSLLSFAFANVLI